VGLIGRISAHPKHSVVFAPITVGKLNCGLGFTDSTKPRHRLNPTFAWWLIEPKVDLFENSIPSGEIEVALIRHIPQKEVCGTMDPPNLDYIRNADLVQRAPLGAGFPFPKDRLSEPLRIVIDQFRADLAQPYPVPDGSALVSRKQRVVPWSSCRCRGDVSGNTYVQDPFRIDLWTACAGTTIRI
jgi:hypothetical protein